MGYHDCVTPPVILRNVVENPAWYTQYTPYQAEVSQGRLEALLNFQTMVSDLTGAAGRERVAARRGHRRGRGDAHDGVVQGRADDRRALLVSDQCHPQTIDVIRTRAVAHGIEVVVADAGTFDFAEEEGVRRRRSSTRRPTGASTTGRASSTGRTPTARSSRWRAISSRSRWSSRRASSGADIAVGSAQRFGVPLGYGGPHAAFFACKNELVRKLPGRIIGVSVDAHGKPALRMALQTREQHIRREKATSNVCTAQALLANVASFYAVYHGPKGIRAIAERVHGHAAALALGPAASSACASRTTRFFDTLRVEGDARRRSTAWLAAAPRPQDEPAPHRRAVARHRARRDDVRRRGRRAARRLPRRPGARRSSCGELAREASPAPRRPRAHERVPDAPRLQRAPLRDGDAPLHPLARGARHLARALDDPARARAR